MSTAVDATVFAKAYSLLNKEQKKAVDTIEGPVMVVAGPGTGKTQILVLRIANILKQTDVTPENILALTFTESGARAMKERLRTYIGSAAYRVPVYTFHGFAQRLIAEYPDSFTRIIGGRPASDLEKIELIEIILESGDYTLLRPIGDPSYYVKPLMHTIAELKQEYVTPARLAELLLHQAEGLEGIEKIHQKGAHKGKVRSEYTKYEKMLAKNTELLAVYQRYEALLRERRLYDFEDMIIEAVSALSNDISMLRDLQETYQYVLADEHQDVNGSQNRILELLCSFHDSPNIFVVGDEKQAIYRFQGASLENFLYFTDVFPATVTISLTENYRSGQPILDIAHSLVAIEDEALTKLRVPLKAAASTAATVERHDFSHQAVEDDWLVSSIKEQLQAGVAPEEVVVLLRTNREVEVMAAKLRQSGIVVTATAEGDVLEHPITKTVQSLIDFVLTDTNEGALFRVLHGAYWGLSTQDLVKIASARTYDQSLMSILSNPELLASLTVEAIDVASRIVAVQAEARARTAYEAPHQVVAYVVQASGLTEYVMLHAPFEGSRILRRLYDEIEAMVVRDGVSSLLEVSRMFERRRRYSLPLTAPYISTHTHAVQVMTVHKSKGLEFSTVYLPHLQDGPWGGHKKSSSFKIPLHRYQEVTAVDSIDDERRLLYVAMTRAKHTLHISTAAKNSSDKEVLSSRLLTDLPPALLPEITTESYERTFELLTPLQASRDEVAINTEFLRKSLAERGFSATSLNNYIKNPWDYLYRNVLQIPEIKPLHMQFGTVIHNVLQHTTSYHTRHKSWPKDSDIVEWLGIQLRRIPLTTEQYTRLHEKGMEVLFVYLRHLQTTVKHSTREELSISVVLPTGIPELPELPLKGKLDRLDLDKEGSALQSGTDYKTGKPKSRNEIEGLNKSGDASYKRQLVFYALLLSLYDDERYADCREGVLSFVQPTSKGEVSKKRPLLLRMERWRNCERELLPLSGKGYCYGTFLIDTVSQSESKYADLAQQFKR
jgi:DNA helicase II / ATP-dependent DNA helicase PcrA